MCHTKQENHILFLYCQGYQSHPYSDRNISVLPKAADKVCITKVDQSWVVFSGAGNLQSYSDWIRFDTSRLYQDAFNLCATHKFPIINVAVKPRFIHNYLQAAWDDEAEGVGGCSVSVKLPSCQANTGSVQHHNYIVLVVYWHPQTLSALVSSFTCDICLKVHMCNLKGQKYLHNL